MALTNNNDIIFRQLFDSTSSTYTYLLADVATRDALIIDPVLEQVDRDLGIIQQLGLNLVYALNTHVHADHVTSSGVIKSRLPQVKSAISEASAAHADIRLKNGDTLHLGNKTLRALSTPGHTNGCMSYVCDALRCVFTGDALFVRGCGRTDFQQGNAELLYDSVHSRLFTLPRDYTVYPAHDYKGHTASSIDEEMRLNPRLSKSKAEFVEIMRGLNLPYPKQMDRAVPLNMVCGVQGDIEAK